MDQPDPRRDARAPRVALERDGRRDGDGMGDGMGDEVDEFGMIECMCQSSVTVSFSSTRHQTVLASTLRDSSGGLKLLEPMRGHVVGEHQPRFAHKRRKCERFAAVAGAQVEDNFSLLCLARQHHQL